MNNEKWMLEVIKMGIKYDKEHPFKERKWLKKLVDGYSKPITDKEILEYKKQFTK